MELENYFEFLASDDIRIKGTRIGIESILYEYIHRAQTPEEIASRFHTVSVEQVYATILYYLQNRDTVSAYLADWLEEYHRRRDEQKRNPPPMLKRLSQVRADRLTAASSTPR
jgi:uncharacterized protein (DUF433 family)